MRVARRLLQVGRLRRQSLRAECRLDLAQRARDDDPEQQRDECEEREVVEEKPEPAGKTPAAEPFDAGTHRRRDDHAEEDERDQQLQLPQRECSRDDRDDDQRGDRSSFRGFAHD